MKNFSDILKLLLVLVMPIGLGYFFRLARIFKDHETDVLRKFVIKICVPFLVFKNLYKTEISVLDQFFPSVFAFIVLCIIYIGSAYLLSLIISSGKRLQNTYAFAVSMGNYMFLGWGVVFSFYGEGAFTRSVFFTVFFWPVFLLGGFWLVHRQSISQKHGHSFVSILLRNGAPAFLAALLGIGFNLLHFQFPAPVYDLVDKFALFTIPMILLVIGLNFKLKMRSADFKIIVWASFTRLVGGIIVGVVAWLITRMFFAPDPLTVRVILMESIMPTAAMTVFFLDYTEMDRELLAGVITFSTLLSLVTIPMWYLIIEKYILTF